MQMIRASEVGEYIYCARAWWLRRVAGETPTGQERREYGTLLHARHSRSIALSVLLLWVAGLLLAAGVLLLVM